MQVGNHDLSTSVLSFGDVKITFLTAIDYTSEREPGL